MTRDRKSAANSRERRPDGTFAPGNPGRPRGARNRATQAIETLIEGEAAALGRKAVDLALAGDVAALKICLDRLAPPRRDRPIDVELPQIRTAADAMAALGVLAQSMARGDLTPEEAQRAGAVIETAIRLGDLADLEQRLTALEKVTKR